MPKIVLSQEFIENINCYKLEILRNTTLKDDETSMFTSDALKCFYKIAEHLYYDIIKPEKEDHKINYDLIDYFENLRIVTIEALRVRSIRKLYSKVKAEFFCQFYELFLTTLEKNGNEYFVEKYPVVTENGEIRMKAYNFLTDKYVLEEKVYDVFPEKF